MIKTYNKFEGGIAMTENENIDIRKSHEQHYEEHSDDDNHNHDNLNLKGTLIMVMSLGGVIVVSWVLAFLLFMSRM